MSSVLTSRHLPRHLQSASAPQPPNTPAHFLAFLPLRFPVRSLPLSAPLPACQRPARSPLCARLAIIGTLPSTFRDAVLPAHISPDQISLTKAVTQHLAYTRLLSCAPSLTALHQLPASPASPDSVFVEDPAILLSSRTAFLPLAGHPSRAAEAAHLAPLLRSLGMRLVRGGVRVDGGDVLRVPGFVFVGLSERSEEGAVAALQEALDEDPGGIGGVPKVVSVRVRGELHLKSVMTWVGEVTEGANGFLVAPDSVVGRDAVREVERASQKRWDVTYIPEAEKLAANVLYVPEESGVLEDDNRGGYMPARLIMQATCPRASRIVAEKLKTMSGTLQHVETCTVDASEIAKANGALTCMSLIV